MRTTLDIEDDVLTAAALTGDASAQRSGAAVVAGFRPFAASDQRLVSNEQIDKLRDLEGL